jgi:hypothetical protein
VRYVAVYLGTERVVPNDAASVLRNRFGDCKDKVTLMAALLAAKGIRSEPALINSGGVYTLPEPPTMAALNHVILYLPDFDLYDDPTVSPAAFGVLAPDTYNKPVLRVSADGARVARTPVMKADDHVGRVKTTIKIAANGAITGNEQHRRLRAGDAHDRRGRAEFGQRGGRALNAAETQYAGHRAPRSQPPDGPH